MLNRARIKLCKSCFAVKHREEFPDINAGARKCGTVVMNKHSVCKQCTAGRDHKTKSLY